MGYDTFSSFDNFDLDKKKLLSDDQFTSFVYNWTSYSQAGSILGMMEAEAEFLEGIKYNIFFLRQFADIWTLKAMPLSLTMNV